MQCTTYSLSRPIAKGCWHMPCSDELRFAVPSLTDRMIDRLDYSAKRCRRAVGHPSFLLPATPGA